MSKVKYSELNLTSIALSWTRKTVLQALIVSAVTLRAPQQRQKPPHGHLMVEDALTGIKSVCHIDVMSFVSSLLKVCLFSIGLTTPTFCKQRERLITNTSTHITSSNNTSG